MSGRGLEQGFDEAGIGARVVSVVPVDWRPKCGTITHMPDRLIANNPNAYLSPGALLNRLRSEFSYVEADGEEGRRHALETIRRLRADYSPRHVDLRMVEQLERVKNSALFVRCAAALGYALVKDRRTIHDPGYGRTERRGFRRERRRFTERRLSPTDRRSL